MSADAILFVVHEALCLLLFYGVFCRASKTSEATTRREVRLVLLLEGTVAMVGMSLPLVRDYHPSFFSVCLLGAMTLPKLVFAPGLRLAG